MKNQCKLFEWEKRNVKTLEHTEQILNKEVIVRPRYRLIVMMMRRYATR
jgi:hypothetical protein